MVYWVDQTLGVIVYLQKDCDGLCEEILEGKNCASKEYQA